ncbi:MAG: lysylphosphatidylglycerol synthase transmembrane domain-containing protein, partial [Firmicutes bacterium]|nr:lysylphosphatidylglycerol synthase transmembrane domain-containing protein [Bacillota bacterium]
MELNEKDIVVTSGGVEVANTPAPKKKKSKRHLINMVLVLLIAALVIFFSLKDDFNAVIASIASANVSYLLIAFGMAIVIFFVDGLILYILARLYTTRYNIGQGLANGMIGVFYNDVTPSTSGGQFMQAYTFKKQGLELSSAASILVMHFLIYQSVLVLYGIAALILKLPLFIGLNPVADFGNFKLTLIPLSIVGFAINFTVIASILLLSYSKWMHTFAINSVVAIGTKMKLIKHPEATRQNWQAQIENFRIELRRLQSNIPVTLLLAVLFFVKLTIFYSIPYVIGLALRAPMTASFFDTVYLS